MTSLEYTKYILEKVSFSADLFEKELRKSLKMLLPDEVNELKKWCYQKFGRMYALQIDNSLAVS